MQEDIQHLSANETIGWLKVDAKPVKQALSTWVTKWLFTFTQFLSNQVTNAVDEFYEFFAGKLNSLSIRNSNLCVDSRHYRVSGRIVMNKSMRDGAMFLFSCFYLLLIRVQPAA